MLFYTSFFCGTLTYTVNGPQWTHLACKSGAFPTYTLDVRGKMWCE